MDAALAETRAGRKKVVVLSKNRPKHIGLSRAPFWQTAGHSLQVMRAFTMHGTCYERNREIPSETPLQIDNAPVVRYIQPFW